MGAVIFLAVLIVAVGLLVILANKKMLGSKFSADVNASEKRVLNFAQKEIAKAQAKIPVATSSAAPANPLPASNAAPLNPAPKAQG